MSATDSAVQQVRRVIDRLVRAGHAVARVDGSHHNLFPVAIPAAEGETLRRWVCRERATRTIEVGLAYGISALYLCEGLLGSGAPEARHMVIDPFQATRFADCGLQFLEEAGLTGMVEHIPETSQLVLPRLLAGGQTFDFAFVDGNHRFDAAFVDLYYLGRLLRPGSVIFLDDWQLPGIARAAAFYLNNLKWRVEEISEKDNLHQWAVLRTSIEEDRRSFDYFVEF